MWSKDQQNEHHWETSVLEIQNPSDHPRPTTAEAVLYCASQPWLHVRITWEALKNTNKRISSLEMLIHLVWCEYWTPGF